MSLFRHTIAEYACTKRCGYHRSVAGANVSPFHLMAATAAAVPLWVFSLHEEFPWYYFICILAGELILMFAAGFLSGILLMPFTLSGTSVCRQCGAPVLLAGRHFNPAGSPKAHWTDIVIFVVFLILNIAVWIQLLR
jgi:hypothetical protein